MKRYQILLPLLLINLTSCGTINRMNCLLDQSTASIDANREAVERSSYTIGQNAMLVDETTRALEENRRLLEAELSK